MAGRHETKRQALTGAVKAFIDLPAHWARLVDDRALVESAIEDSGLSKLKGKERRECRNRFGLYSLRTNTT
jgi:hypothetical protein